jgi:hypothetical protein
MVFKVSGGTRQHNLISIFKLSRNQCEAVLNNGIYFYTSRVKVRMYFYKYGPIGTFLWFSVSIFVPILFWP